MFLWWHLKSACVKRGGDIYQINSRGHMCRFNGYSRQAQHWNRHCTSVFFFLWGCDVLLLELEMVVASCNIPMHFANFETVWLRVNPLIIFSSFTWTVCFIFLRKVSFFCINSRRFSDCFLVFLHYYAVLIRALGTPALWMSCRPPVPADPAVTALLIIFGPQLPDSRTEHVRIRSSEQTGATERSSSARFYPSHY